ADASREARSTALYFRLRQAELHYQPGWPARREGRGELHMANGGLRVALSGGRLLDSRLREAGIQQPPPAADEPAHRSRDSGLQSWVADGLRILQDSPLPTDGTFAAWSGEGALETRLQLGIPLAAGHVPRADVRFSGNGARLSLPYMPGLDIEAVQGDFRFDTARGFSARGLKARFLAESLQGRIDTAILADRQRTLVDVQGRMPVDRLAQWLDYRGPLPASGRLPYRLRLRLDGRDSQLRVDSSLQGVA